MIRKLLRLFGYEIVYVCNWGEYDSPYDTWERPVHEDMRVAPPWARRKIRKIKP